MPWWARSLRVWTEGRGGSPRARRSSSGSPASRSSARTRGSPRGAAFAGRARSAWAGATRTSARACSTRAPWSRTGAGSRSSGEPLPMNGRYAFILAGGVGSRLCLLSEKRAKPAVPFGGKYRIIDFTLSNCVNSGIFDVGILTQYRPLSLRDHIGLGRAWDLDRKRGGVELLQPFQGWSVTDWYRGTADAVW